MTRDQFSYWITVTPDKTLPGPRGGLLKALAAALAQTPVLDPCSLLRIDPDSEEECLCIEVNPTVGTIEEDTGIRTALDAFVPQWPGFRFELTELDEDDKSVQIHSVWHAGKLVRRGHARLVRADEHYDRVTADLMLDFLFGDRLDPVTKTRIRDDFAGYLARKGEDPDA